MVDINVCPIPDKRLQDVTPTHTRGMVHRSASVVPAAIGVSTSFQQDLSALQVTVHHSHIQGRLSLDIHQVHLRPFAYEEVHTVPMACGGCDSQWCAGEPATAPDRLLIDAAPVALLLQEVPEGLEVPYIGCIMESRIFTVLQWVVTELLPQPLLQIRTCTAGPGPARPLGLPPSAMPTWSSASAQTPSSPVGLRSDGVKEQPCQRNTSGASGRWACLELGFRRVCASLLYFLLHAQGSPLPVWLIDLIANQGRRLLGSAGIWGNASPL